MKYLKLIALILTATMQITVVNADGCSSEENRALAVKANYVKVSYEVEDNSEHKKLTANGVEKEYIVPNYVFNVSLYNIVPEIYVTVTNVETKQTFDVTSDMTSEGTYKFSNDDFGTIHNYTFTIKSKNDNCYGKTLRTLKQTLPKYNAYSEFAYCKNSSSFYCQKFIGTELNIKTTEDFYRKISGNNKNDSSIKKDNNFSITENVKNNWRLYLIIIALIVIVSFLIIIVIKKKKGSSELE